MRFVKKNTICLSKNKIIIRLEIQWITLQMRKVEMWISKMEYVSKVIIQNAMQRKRSGKREFKRHGSSKIHLIRFQKGDNIYEE